MTRDRGAAEPVGEDGLLESDEPRWLVALDDWLTRRMATPPPRWARMRWTETVTEKAPWAVPFVVAGSIGFLAFLTVGVTPKIQEWLR